MGPEYHFGAGVIFAGVGLLFLWGAFKRDELHTTHRDIVHFVCAFCGGAAGAFFTGSALLSLDTPVGTGGRFAIQGTAGVALFIFVLLIFRWRGDQLQGTSGVGVSTSGSNPFSQIAQAIAEGVDATIDLSALTAEERDVRPSSAQINFRTVDQAKVALMHLYDLVEQGTMRRYSVTYDASSKRFTITV